MESQFWNVEELTLSINVEFVNDYSLHSLGDVSYLGLNKEVRYLLDSINSHLLLRYLSLIHI